MPEGITIVYQVTRAKIGTVELDASISESHSRAIEVTDHPVEQGASISDHRRRKPDSVQITGLVSNTPVGREEQERAGEAVKGSPGRADNAYAELLRLSESHELIDVVTRRRVYTNMTITSLDAPVDAQTGDALRFTATLREVVVVSSQTVKLEKNAKANAKKKTGKKTGKKADAPTERRASLALRLYEALGGQ